MTLCVKGSGALALLLPAFAFDGEVHPEISAAANTLAVSYRGWVCRYTAADAVLADTGRMAANRNGHYRVFAAEGENRLTVRITVEKE